MLDSDLTRIIKSEKHWNLIQLITAPANVLESNNLQIRFIIECDSQSR